MVEYAEALNHPLAAPPGATTIVGPLVAVTANVANRDKETARGVMMNRGWPLEVKNISFAHKLLVVSEASSVILEKEGEGPYLNIDADKLIDGVCTAGMC